MIRKTVYWSRSIENILENIETTFPVIVITGPRQSGKSTLLSRLIGKKGGTTINLDNPNTRLLLQDDPLSFLEQVKKPILIDEIQHVPELASYVKILVDKDRTPGLWFLTGSHQFSVMKNVSESLAGRAAILSLPTFQIREREDIETLESYLLGSSYPELATNKQVNQDIWYSSYVQTYLERDVRSIMNVSSLRDFEQLIRLLAARTGQSLNYSHLANDLGIKVPTVKSWISVLEASYIIFLVPPFFENYGKRIIKAPKLYFYDTGLVNYLIGIKDANTLINGPMAGSIFETALASEIMKRQMALGVRPEIFYWRSQSGIAIDLIVKENAYYTPYEFKLSRAIKPAFYKHLKYWLELNPTNKTKGYLVSNCPQQLPLPGKIESVFWKDL